MTFDGGNYTAPQVVTVTGKDDPVGQYDNPNTPYSITFAAIVSGNSYFNGKTPPAVNLINKDDDIRADNDEFTILEDSPLTLLNVNANDADLGGNGTYYVYHTNVFSPFGAGTVEPDGGKNILFQPIENLNGVVWLQDEI